VRLRNETAVRLRNGGTSGSLVLEQALGWSWGVVGWVEKTYPDTRKYGSSAMSSTMSSAMSRAVL
jgi:hypothetical protein